MFESAEISHDIDKAEAEKYYPDMRTALLDAQFDLVESGTFPVIIVIAGMEGSGMIDAAVNAHTVLDSRHLVTHTFDSPTEEEAERPEMWRFWRVLPAKGDIGTYLGSWYGDPPTGHIMDKSSKESFEQQLERVKRFETMLANEGALILKFWFHLGKDAQKEKLKKFENSERTKWRVEDSLWGGSKRYKKVRKAAEDMMRVTGTEQAPWIVVNAENPHYRGLTVGRTILNAIRSRLDNPVKVTEAVASVTVPQLDDRTVLSTLELLQMLEKKDYKKQLAKYQDRLNELVSHKKFKKHSVVLAFEGNDAAGKGGAIRRVTEFLDPRVYRVHPIAAPTDEEKAQPYLWRFWRRLPRRGHIGIFDRTWYGRVLVERVEGFCSEADWRRAYSEINEFETEMMDAGVIVIKFWLAIDQDEQAARFKAREETGYKRYKITDEDWRNREKWDEYASAVCDMVNLTSTSKSPWTLVEANNKYYSRVKVLKTICKRIEQALK